MFLRLKFNSGFVMLIGEIALDANSVHLKKKYNVRDALVLVHRIQFQPKSGTGKIGFIYQICCRERFVGV